MYKYIIVDEYYNLYGTNDLILANKAAKNFVVYNTETGVLNKEPLENISPLEESGWIFD